MKVYITRHGQVAKKSEYIDGNAMYPAGESPLSDLGREQAHLLGKHLHELGFCGEILSSPYLRTMETAQIIAEETGCKVYPYAPIREIFKTQSQADKYKGSTLEELKARFSAVADAAVLDYPWWVPREETLDDVFERVAAGIPPLDGKREVLFVGHGASAGELIKYYEIKKNHTLNSLYNCSLSFIDTEDTDAKRTHCDVSFMPYEKVTNNFITREEYESAIIDAPYAGEIELPEGFDPSRRYLLHIGDTYSRDYPYFRKLIELTKPEVIVHTGDMADEVKVGRIPGTEYEYLFKVGKLLEIFANSGARRVVVVPGNNELPDEVKKRAPFVELLGQGEIFTDSGYSFWVKHSVTGLDSDADFMLYGHTLKNDRWKFEMNKKGSQCRNNAYWGSLLVDLDDGGFYQFLRP